MHISDLIFDKHGLISAVVTDINTSEVLMVAYMNQESIRQTLAMGDAVFFSRSKQTLWHKGATSGNYMIVHEIMVDCDGDCLLLKVEIKGNQVACHTGSRSCFFQRLEEFGENQENYF